MIEPRLTDDDAQVWSRWCATWRLHARTRTYASRVRKARERVRETFAKHERVCVAFSGGKDSRVMLELIDQEARALRRDFEIMSHKDDCDYPGELEYVRRESARYGRELTVLTPAFSVAEWMAANARGVDDFHSRASDLSDRAFYSLVTEYNARFDAVFLGLRADESHARRMNRRMRGTLYTKANGETISTPIADWRGNDVFAFALENEIELLPIYKCLAFANAREPWRIREAWWLPNGVAACLGGVAWLRRYYPSLYRQLCEWWPTARSLA